MAGEIGFENNINGNPILGPFYKILRPMAMTQIIQIGLNQQNPTDNELKYL